MKILKAKSMTPSGYAKRTTQNSVVNELGAQILRGDFAVGTNLPNEGDLTARFGVSRTVIREVMKTLAAKGLVIAKTKIGTRVSDPSNWNMFDRDVLNWRIQAGVNDALLNSLYELRSAIEPTAAALAAERRSDADVAELRILLDRMAYSGHTPISFLRADVDFHQAVGRISRNPFMGSIGPIIEAALNDASLKIPSPANSPQRQSIVVARHRVIADAIEARDPRAARAAMIVVIDEGLSDRVTAPTSIQVPA